MSSVLQENRGFGNPNYNQITLGTEHGMIAGQQQLEQSSINRSLQNLMQLGEILRAFLLSYVSKQVTAIFSGYDTACPYRWCYVVLIELMSDAQRVSAFQQELTSDSSC